MGTGKVDEVTTAERLSLFVDASGWIAINDPRDGRNKAASHFYKEKAFKEYNQFVTTNLIVAETHAYLLKVGGRAYGLKYLALINSSTRINVVHSTAELEEAALKLLFKYQDQGFSFCDAVSFTVMRGLGIKDAFAFDRHFETAEFRRLP